MSVEQEIIIEFTREVFNFKKQIYDDLYNAKLDGVQAFTRLLNFIYNLDFDIYEKTSVSPLELLTQESTLEN